MFLPSSTQAATQSPVSMKARASTIGFYRDAYLYFAMAFVVTLAGFWPSFFTRLGRTDAAHMIHGTSATLWMAVPVVQAWLIGHRQLKWHRRLGKASLLLAPVLVASGLHMVQIMLLKAFRNDPGLSQALRLRFAFLDISAMAFFVLVLLLALRAIYRKDVRAHAQYMACTVLIALEPAVERFLLFWVPGIGDFGAALNVSLFTMEAIVAGLLYVEWRSGRLRPGYVMTFVFFVAVHLLLEPVSGSKSFQSFAHWFAAL
jgi:hypothetical protein